MSLILDKFDPKNNDSIWANEDLLKEAHGQSEEQKSFLISPRKCNEDIYRHSKFSSI